MKTSIVIMLLSLILSGCGAAAKHNSQGNARYYSGDYEAALRAYQQAQVAEPDHAEAYFNAASALVAQGDADDAVDALEQALRSADNELAADALYNLGNVYYETERYGQAVEAYKQVLIRRPNDQQARYNLELALLNALAPTPTAQEQQTSPDMGETDPETTPTDQPGGFEGPTPTPPPQELEPSATPVSGESAGGADDSATAVPQQGGDMTAEQAERLLDQIQQEQQALMEFLEQVGSGGQPSERDW